MIFDLVLDATLNLYETREYLEIFEPMFDALEVDPEDYDWALSDSDKIQDLEYVRCLALGNLIYAAQDAGIFPDYLDADNFDFEGSVSFDMNSYDEEEAEEIREAFKIFKEKTGIVISIKE